VLVIAFRDHGLELFGSSLLVGTSHQLRVRRFIVHVPESDLRSFSSSYFPQNITRAEAEERIATAKVELAELFSLFPELQTETSGLRPAFYFCYDDGKTAGCVARNEDGQFTYSGPGA
jgi:hypothetical protein